jgi:hypothetical protein
MQGPWRSDAGGKVDRRTWMAGVVAAWMSGPCRAEAPDGAEADEDRECEAVEANATRAGLRPFGTNRTRHFLGLGDAPEAFRALTLRDCEAVAADYLDHYRAKGFPVALPERRLTVVILNDDRSFAAYSGNKSLRMVPRSNGPAPSIHGSFSRTDNRLQVFDHRSLGPQLAGRPGYENLRTLAHELTHQLTFNTGLLDRRGDVPACVVEGLAMYGEVRKLTGRTAPGQINRMRIDNLAAMQRRRIPWIPIPQLLVDDHHVGNAATHEGLLAYAESWLLVDYLMKERSELPGFRAYLERIRGRRDGKYRLDDARVHLGDLDRLDVDLRRYSVRLLKS